MILLNHLLDEPSTLFLTSTGDTMLEKLIQQVVISPHSNPLLAHCVLPLCPWATPTLFLNFKHAPHSFYKMKFLLSPMFSLMIFQLKVQRLNMKMRMAILKRYLETLAYVDSSGNMQMMSIVLCTALAVLESPSQPLKLS